MGCFVITRSTDGGETILDYLAPDGYSWVESGAVAQWFRTEEEAQIYLDTSQLKAHPNLFIKSYNPIDTLVNPTETDQNAMIQTHLRNLLRT